MASGTNYINTADINYCGKEAQEIFTKDIFDLDIRGLGVTYLDGVRGRRKIYLGDWDNAWQKYDCSWSPDGQVKLSETYIEPTPIKVNKEWCTEEFLDTYLAEQTSITLQGGIPVSFAEFYFTKLREVMKKEYTDLWWNGDTDYSGSTKAYRNIMDGVVKQITTNSAATEVSGSTFTVDNILSQVEAVINAGLAAAVEGEYPTDNFKVFMNYADVRTLLMSLGQSCCPNNQSIFSNYAKGANGNPVIFGYEIVPTMIDKNTILFGPARNLILGYDSFNSHLEYRIISMKEHTLEDKYRVGAFSSIAAGVIYPELFTYLKA